MISSALGLRAVYLGPASSFFSGVAAFLTPGEHGLTVQSVRKTS